MYRLLRFVGLVALLPFFSSASAADSTDARLTLERGDKIVLIGNTLAERMQYFGRWEPLLQSRFPEHELVVRNLGWSADELAVRPRSKDFDDHGHRLEDHQPDVVFAMFGWNESFAGEAGLETFREQLRAFIETTTSTAYNGQSPPKLVLFSPIPHEDLGRRELPDGEATNHNVERYTAAMADEADAAGVRFVDLYEPMKARMQSAETPLTINGIHLNDEGNRHLGEVIDRALFGPRPENVAADLDALHEAVLEKDRQFFYDYRAVNGYYIYGGRKEPYGVVNFPAEFAKLRKMVEVRDRRIWKIARGESVPETIDDSDTGSFVEIESNVAEDLVITPPEEALRSFKLPEGYVAELVASEVEFDDLQNPVQFAIDGRGRIWVCTMPSYPMYLPGEPPNDKILILEDTNGDGKADKRTVFADGLHLPTGIELGDGGCYVAQQPNLMFLKDTDGDDVADERQLILHGFDTADSHHAISAFEWGPGGALYFQEGTFHHTQVETPYGPRRVRDAAVFRYEPRSEKFDIFVSYPFANPWGHTFDRWGQNFVADASPGANYYGTAFSGEVIHPTKHRRMNEFLTKQWRPTCGCEFVSSENFPEEAQGNYLLNNTIGFLGVLQYRMKDDGSGFAADPVEPLLQSSDNNFRPVDLQFGPDGALYICDWFNPLIGHMQHNLRDPKRDKQHGRIWRVRYEDRPLAEIPDIEDASTDELVALLESYQDRTRFLVRRELRERPTDEVLAALDAWIDRFDAEDDRTEHHRLEALWVCQHHDVVREDLLDRVLESPRGEARAAATRVLCYWRDRVDDAADRLVELARDDHPRVRLEAVRAASFLTAAEGRRIVDIAMQEPLDYYLQYTINETTTTLDQRGGSVERDQSETIQRLAEGRVAEPRLVATIELAGPEMSPAQLGQLALALLDNTRYSPGGRAAALGAIAEIADDRDVKPAVDGPKMGEHLKEALRRGHDALSEQIAAVAAPWEIQGMTEALQMAVTRSETPGPTVQRAMEALLEDPTPSAHDTVAQLTRRNDRADLRLRVAAAMARKSTGRAAELFAATLSDGAPEYDLVRVATEALLRQNNGAAVLAEAIERNPPDRDAAKLVLRAMYAAGRSDAELVDPVSRAAGIDSETPPMSAEEKAALGRRVAEQGDPEQGQIVFRRDELSCVKCHALSGAGGRIGPDLSSIGANSPIEYLIDSILYPSQQIKEEFITRNVLTVDGQVIRGIRVDEDDRRMLLRDADGRTIRIPVDDIEQEFEGPSLMPEGLHHLMTDQEFLDLVNFLWQLGKPGPFAVNDRPTFQRYQRLDDEAARERLASAAEGEMEGMLDALPDDVWTSAYALVDGRLPLDEITGDGAATTPIVLRGEIDVTVGGPVVVSVQPPTAVQVVVDGRSIDPNGMQPIELDEGRHAVYLVYEEQPPSEVTAEVQRPDGSKAQYVIVGGE